MKYCYYQTGLIEDDNLYVVDMELGLLMKYDLKSYTYEILTKLELNRVKKMHWYVNKILKVGDLLYLCLRDYAFIMTYNLKTGVIETYGEEQDQSVQTRAVVVYKNELWFFPYFSNQEIRVFNIQTKDFRKKDTLKKYLQTAGYYLDNEYEIRFIREDGNLKYCALMGTPYIVSLDLSKNTTQVYETKKDYKIFNVTYDGRNYWISFMDNKKLVKWSVTEGVLEEREIKEIETDERGNTIMFAFEKNDNMFIISKYDEHIISYKKRGDDLQGNKIKCFERTHPNKKRVSFLTPLFIDQKIILLPFAANKILVLNVDTGDITSVDSIISKEEWIRYGVTTESIKDGIDENEYFNLNEYLQFLSEKENHKKH